MNIVANFETWIAIVKFAYPIKYRLIAGEDPFAVIRHVCTVCENRCEEYPAMIQRENGTDICSQCGIPKHKIPSYNQERYKRICSEVRTIFDESKQCYGADKILTNAVYNKYCQ